MDKPEIVQKLFEYADWAEEVWDVPDALPGDLRSVGHLLDSELTASYNNGYHAGYHDGLAKSHQVLTIDAQRIKELQEEKHQTCCGYDVEELVRFGQIMRALGVEESDIKNFIHDSTRVYSSIVDRIIVDVREAVRENIHTPHIQLSARDILIDPYK